jgi:hypothetical protein
LEIKLVPLHPHNQVIFQVRRLEDGIHPSVSLQMPRDIAEFIKESVEYVMEHDAKADNQTFPEG